MPDKYEIDKYEIMDVVRQGLKGIDLVEPGPAGDKGWTRAVKEKLCEIGQGSFCCKVATNGVSKADYKNVKAAKLQQTQKRPPNKESTCTAFPRSISCSL
jgi:hypothetical protein